MSTTHCAGKSPRQSIFSIFFFAHHLKIPVAYVLNCSPPLSQLCRRNVTKFHLKRSASANEPRILPSSETQRERERERESEKARMR